MTEPAFSPVETSRRLIRQARTAALATIARRTGHPFGSMVSVACEPDGTPILLMSTLAAHSRNLAEDPRASLLYEDRTVPDPQQGGRVTVVGRIERIEAATEAARRYLARLPEAALYAGFGDFAFFRLVVEEAHLVAGFGRAMRVRREDLLLDPTGCEALVAAEAAVVAAIEAEAGRVAPGGEARGAGRRLARRGSRPRGARSRHRRWAVSSVSTPHLRRNRAHGRGFRGGAASLGRIQYLAINFLNRCSSHYAFDPTYDSLVYIGNDVVFCARSMERAQKDSQPTGRGPSPDFEDFEKGRRTDVAVQGGVVFLMRIGGSRSGVEGGAFHRERLVSPSRIHLE
ncbi:HugZ family protein [Pinisolibacter aquiterrae]|uniref:HugZ family pyridoxamine 5'-phosphate oxidase n=1 Tax=Pinisolibacter aquiterrae TaxID=2815579 RepID=UPI001C3E16FE|nr:pyridoxamine 5'-phosphate oxidase family protein [Pinisolibacter aquiterrae]MBV5262879.1 pyridoxamine 5'-phosphate oxidase family protein [Pinisolibacter aquiterrae]MCC8236406.1 CREG family protein [Pinisolibacter aquiterrae]